MNQRYSQVSAVPLSLGVFLAHDNYDHNPDPLHMSATTIIKPLRQIVLAARVPESDAVVDLASMMASRLGTAIHSGIEHAWINHYQTAMASLGFPQHVINLVRINPTADEVAANPDIIPVYMEQRLTKKVGKWTISGKFDFIGQGRLEDFKNTSAFVVMNHTNDEKFAKQGSIYRWMGPHLITQDHMAIQFIIRDWAAARARAEQNYPQRAFVERILSLEPAGDIQIYVERKLALIERYWDAPESEVPPCSDDELQRSEAVFKYYANPDNAAKGGRSTKNFNDKPTAMAHLASAGKGVVKEVPGQVTACRFCNAFAACTQKDALVAAGDLTL